MNTTIIANREDIDYDFNALNTALNIQFDQYKSLPLFKTNKSHKNAVWDLFLDNLPESIRQQHNCSCCRHFIQKYGSLVTITDEGNVRSVLFSKDMSEIPEYYHASVNAMRKYVEKATIDTVFISGEETGILGTPETGVGYLDDSHIWYHMSVRHEYNINYSATPNKQMAARRQDYQTLTHALVDYKHEYVKQALNILEANTLYRGEKVKDIVEFLHNVYTEIEGNKPHKRNIIWKAVALAPPGFCTPRSGMTGTLLNDIKAGKSIESIKRSFSKKMDPTQYRRPTAPPADSTIEQAEKLISQLGIESALQRRFAHLSDVQLMWEPKVVAEKPKPAGVFGHLRNKDDSPIFDAVPSGTPITWSKFANNILSRANSISVYTPSQRQNFCGLLTAEDPSSLPILQWDTLERRNQVSWYVNQHGATPEEFNLPSNQWQEVIGITLLPTMWESEDKYSHFGKSAIFLLKNARSINKIDSCLFPETMRSELHSVRKVIEAHSNKTFLEKDDNAIAGIRVGEQPSFNKIKVKTDLGEAIYTIDRWD